MGSDTGDEIETSVPDPNQPDLLAEVRVGMASRLGAKDPNLFHGKRRLENFDACVRSFIDR